MNNYKNKELNLKKFIFYIKQELFCNSNSVNKQYKCY